MKISPAPAGEYKHRLVLDIYPLRRLDLAAWRSPGARAAVLEKLPYLAMAVATVLVTSLTISLDDLVARAPGFLYPALNKSDRSHVVL